MKFNVLYNFISPVIGRILADPNYVLVGNRDGIAIPSPILLDIRLDIANLRKGSSLDNPASFVIGTPNSQLPNAQALSLLSDGFIYNKEGAVSTYDVIPLDNLTRLTKGKIWIGDSMNRPQEGDPITGPEGPEGDKGPRGNPGLSIQAILRQLFDQIFGDVLGNLTADIIAKLFTAFVSAYLSSLVGKIGLIGLAGLVGLGGLAGYGGISGRDGAKGQPAINTTVLTNYDLAGHNIEGLAQSPDSDFSLVTTKWVWDLLNDNVIIEWQ